MRDLAAVSPIERSGAFTVPGLRVEEARGLSVSVVRAHRSHAAAVIAALRVAASRDFPAFPNSSVAQGDLRLLWIEPGAWMMIGAHQSVAAAAKAISTIKDPPYLLATDLSSALVCVRLSGALARATIESSCPIDLHPRVFGPGRCARTVFGEFDVTLDQVDEAPTFLMVADRAHAASLWDRLVEAALRAPGVSSVLVEETACKTA
jgi:heterotetrameric sarcosine oxidase gamma subunit